MIYFQPGPSHILEIAAIPRLRIWLAEGEYVIVHAEADCFVNTNLQHLKIDYGSQITFLSYPKKTSIKRFVLISQQIKKVLKEFDIKKCYLHNHSYYENRLFIDMCYANNGSDSIIYIAHALKQHMDVSLDFHLRKLDYINKDTRGKLYRRIKRYCVVNLDIFFSQYFFPFIYTFHFLTSEINFRNGKSKGFISDKYNLQFLCYTIWDEKCFRNQGITNIIKVDHPLCRSYAQGMNSKELDVAFFFTRGIVQYFMDLGYSVSQSVEKYFVEEIKLLRDVVPGLKIGVRLHPNEFYIKEIVSAINSSFDDIIFLNDDSHTTIDVINTAVVIITDGCSVGYVAGVMKKPLVVAIDHHKLPSFSESFYYDGVTYSDSVDSTVRCYRQIPKIIDQFTSAKSKEHI